MVVTVKAGNRVWSHFQTLTEGERVRWGLVATVPVSLAPPNFSSVMTRSLSSSGRLCEKKALVNKPLQEESDWLGADDVTYLQKPLQVDIVLFLFLNKTNTGSDLRVHVVAL